MWTQARTPSPSRRKLRASSKSFASSGSIVNAKRSRRSVRSGSISSGGGGTGACGRRTPSCQSSPSSTAPTSPGRPSTASTFALPAPEAEDDEVARGRIAAPLAVDRDGDAALEEWLAHQELPAPGELGDQRLHVATRRACRPARARPRGSSRHAPSADRCPPSRKAECPGRRGPFPTASDTWPSSA